MLWWTCGRIVSERAWPSIEPYGHLLTMCDRRRHTNIGRESPHQVAATSAAEGGRSRRWHQRARRLGRAGGASDDTTVKCRRRRIIGECANMTRMRSEPAPPRSSSRIVNLRCMTKLSDGTRQIASGNGSLDLSIRRNDGGRTIDGVDGSRHGGFFMAWGSHSRTVVLDTCAYLQRYSLCHRVASQSMPW